MQSELLLTQAFACLFMTGLIWLIQLVHYPSFSFVKEESFATFGLFHGNRISWIVAPIMGIELTTAVFLFYQLPDSLLARWNILSVIGLWACTGLLSVPLHSKLSREYSPSVLRKLVLTNWPRTLLWTARTVVFFQALKGMIS